MSEYSNVYVELAARYYAPEPSVEPQPVSVVVVATERGEGSADDASASS